MYGHILKYRLKCLTKDRDNMFWILIFPIVLSTFLYVALGNIGNQNFLHQIPLGLVAKENSESLQRLINATDLVKFQRMDRGEAERALEDEEVKGYVLMDEDMTFVVRKKGIEQSIARLYLNQYRQMVGTIENILTNHPEQAPNLMRKIETRQTFTKDVSAARAEMDSMLIFFFALIAMACMYGAYLGLREAVDIQADLSDLAARINIAPIHKMKTFFYSISASIIIQAVIISVLLIYLQFVLKINLGDRHMLIYFTAILGSMLGVLGGAFVGTVLKTSENMKNALCTIFSLGGAYLAGLMDYSMKYTVAQNIPILTVINPVNLIADAFYALYIFDSLERFWTNILFIIGFIIIFFLGTYVNVRRRKYASI